MRKTISKWGVCYWCGTTDGPFEADHVFPASLMEDNDIRNLVCSCRKCNREKGNKPVSSMSLDTEPEFRDLEISCKVLDYYYNESLERYKRITPRGYKLFMNKKEWDCKYWRRYVEAFRIDDHYSLEIARIEYDISSYQKEVEELKTDWKISKKAMKERWKAEDEGRLRYEL